jgi:hypothetical protein
MKQLKPQYEDICNAYLHAFCEKHELSLHDAYWVTGRTGEVAGIGDYYVDMSTIRTDIDEDVPEEEWLRYYDYCLRVGEFNMTAPNYDHWLKGCPRVSDAILERLRELHTEIDNIVKEYQPNGNPY